jgi:hypothetical protein
MDGVQIYYAASKQIANVSHKIANISQQIANVSHKMANVSQQIANEDGGGESSLPLACCTGQTADGRCSSGSNWGLRPAATLAAGSGGTRRGGGGCPQRPLVVGRGDGDGAGLPGRPGGFESSPSPPPTPPCGAQRMRLHTTGSNGRHGVVGDGAAAGSCLGGWVASAAPHPPSSWHEAAEHDGFGGQVVEYGRSSVHVKGGGGATRGRCRSAWMEGVSHGWQSRRPCGLGSSPSLHSGGSDLHRQGDQWMV